MHKENEYLQSPEFLPSERLYVISHWGRTPFEIWRGTEVFLGFLHYLQKNDKVVTVDKHWAMDENKCKGHAGALHSVICGDELSASPCANLLLKWSTKWEGRFIAGSEVVMKTQVLVRAGTRTATAKSVATRVTAQGMPARESTD